MAPVELLDPREAYAKPPFNEQPRIDIPGKTVEMNPTPDHGESTYEGTGKLKGLTAIVTGSDSGIGRAVAIAYSREGANVVINFNQSKQDAQQTARLVEEAGAKALIIQGDLQDESFCKALIDKTFDRFDRLDVLVNNAAFQETQKDIEEFSTENFDRVFKTNVYATFWTCREAIPRMTAGGSIINTCSIQGYTPSPELLPYATSKSALIGFTKGLAPLAMKYGVRVNGVAPGPVWTPLIPSTVDMEKTRHFGENTLFERPAQPAELAHLYVWLASPQASYVTAEIFGATGGRTPV